MESRKGEGSAKQFAGGADDIRFCLSERMLCDKPLGLCLRFLAGAADQQLLPNGRHTSSGAGRLRVNQD